MTTKIIVGRPFESEFEQAFGPGWEASPQAAKIYPWPVRVLVFPNKGARHFDMLTDIGRGVVEAVLDGGSARAIHDRVLLVFPERWMTPREDQSFRARLIAHPASKRMTGLDYVTNSATAVSDFMVETIRIVR